MILKKEAKKIKKSISKISINLASADSIIRSSHGEVLKPETINYRTFKPDKDGLFCEKIFGPVRDWECHCGKYKGIRYAGIICDRCGVEVNQKSLRRDRLGHISLSVPVVHIWYFRSVPSKISQILGISNKDLERIIYYENYVVINAGPTSYKKFDMLTEDEFLNTINNLPEEHEELEDTNENKFLCKIGGEAVKELLRRVEVERDIETLRIQLHEETSVQKRTDLIKRIRVLKSFRKREDRRLNKPEWMVLEVIPVIPPELRPLVPLEGGRFATSDLNDLYRRVIIRNNRLKRLIDIKAPEVILRNEKRMLQESVDALLDNSRRATAVKSENRPLKSLSDSLKGKQGRFRQNLLGKRVDYSGRAVIVVGPELKLHECGIPKDMALELFKPFVIRRLIDRDLVKTVKSAKKLIERRTPEVWEVLENVIDSHPVLLNRAPTLHRLSIQAFQPVLVEGKAIRIHPLVCTAFNADFDGDQMAVHVPLSPEAQLEARILMLSSHNLLSPQNGDPIAIANQEIVLGCYYLTKYKKGDKGEGKFLASPDEVMIAYNSSKIGLHAKIKVRIDGEIIETTTGRVIFNRIVPKGVGFINELLTKKGIIKNIARVFKTVGNVETVKFLDALKEIGFNYAMTGGLSVNLDDIVIPDEKIKIIDNAQKKVDGVEKSRMRGLITEGERYNKVIDIWTHATNEVKSVLMNTLKNSREGFNSLHMMIDSGARGSQDQVSQLAGMRGLMAKPQKSMTGQAGEIIENPIISNFKEGLSILEYFISTHGARKGLADTALKTADAGYLTRKLVDVAQDVIIFDSDCGTIRGLKVEALKDGEDIKEPLSERILGRVTLHNITDPITRKILVKAGEEIDEDKAAKIAESSIQSVEIRSVLTCESRRGICAKCYGRNLTTGKIVDVGEAVGVVAAQSIGEPGTQLTLRTFHIGGTASLIVTQSRIPTKFGGKVKYENIKVVKYEIPGQEMVQFVTLSRNGLIHIYDENNRMVSKYDVPYGAHLFVKNGDIVEKNHVLYEWDPYNSVIVAEHSGKVAYVDLVENVSYMEAPDETTGHIQKVVVDSKDKTLSPTIQIKNSKDEILSNYIIPSLAHLMINNGDDVVAGQILVKIPRETGKTRDITGGLPRVTELFEARSPNSPSIVSEIDGFVEIGALKRGSREVKVISEDKSVEKKYLIPVGKHILVRDGDFIKAGEALSSGAVDPHDILRIKGVADVQAYLVNEIQEVYRMQGVKINDKHIEVIVRQMLQKVRIVDPGDTNYLEGDVVHRFKFYDENEQLKNKVVITDQGGSTKARMYDIIDKKIVKELNAELKKKKKDLIKFRETNPAIANPILQGISQTSITTDSFISAASFQETTKVLTDAAIEGKVDYLHGLKENVIVGQLIPAGTGLKRYKELLVLKKDETAVEEEKPKKKRAKKKEKAEA
jgi:DNA-directed RNA polymerase subunit beta'